MILRDPVHGLVAFEGDFEKVVRRLIDTREFQRLRYIRQLGLTSLVFPGAEHSRFSHALGTAHVMILLLQRIRCCEHLIEYSSRLNEQEALEAVAAALLHDIGHGPFSHFFEEVFDNAIHHESWTTLILSDPATEVHGALESLSPGMATRVVDILAGRARLSYLTRAVSGMLDVDRCDYLLRDSYMTGVRYGQFDLDWVLQALTFGTTPSGVEVLAVEGRKGLPPIERFFLGRHHMYQQVYHHKATRAAEALIRSIFRRLAELVRDGTPPEALPTAVRDACLGIVPTLREYLEIDDASLLHAFSVWEHTDDRTLSGLAKRFRARSLPKTLPLPAYAEELWARAADTVRKLSEQQGIRGDLEVQLDLPESTPYAESEGAEDGLWVVLSHVPIQRLSQVSFVLGELKNKKVQRPRLIFPADIRVEVERRVGALL
ncbi:MAG: HD domain-containing protein [Myxococcota bacterium]